LSCERCNPHKGSNIVGYLEGKHVPLFNPRTDRWADHAECHRASGQQTEEEATWGQ
jgi:hypothetical protein